MKHGFLRAACLALLTVLLVSTGAGPANAQNDAAAAADATAAPRELTVGLYVSPPFVMKKGDRYTGMAIDLWDELADRLRLQSSYVEMDT